MEPEMPLPKGALAPLPRSEIQAIVSPTPQIFRLLCALIERVRRFFALRRLSRSLQRLKYPSQFAVKTGEGKGLDGLFLEVLAAEYRYEYGHPLPHDISLPELAEARAELLPQALLRRPTRLLFEQHGIAPLHVALYHGDDTVCLWIRSHLDDPFGWLRTSAYARLPNLRTVAGNRDPVEVYRNDIELFAAFVWANVAHLPEIEEVMARLVPSANSASPSLGAGETAAVLDSEPKTAAAEIASELDTDHSGWNEPEALLRRLFEKARAAAIVAPDESLVRRTLSRVEHALRRVSDFADAYAVGTSCKPAPEWVEQAIDAVEDLPRQSMPTDGLPKLVRRIACRLWVNGHYAKPQQAVAYSSEPPSAAATPDAWRHSASPPPPVEKTPAPRTPPKRAPTPNIIDIDNDTDDVPNGPPSNSEEPAGF